MKSFYLIAVTIDSLLFPSKVHAAYQDQLSAILNLYFKRERINSDWVFYNKGMVAAWCLLTPVYWNLYLEPKWGKLRKTWYLVSVFIMNQGHYQSPDEVFGPHSTIRRQSLCKITKCLMANTIFYNQTTTSREEVFVVWLQHNFNHLLVLLLLLKECHCFVRFYLFCIKISLFHFLGE